MSYLLSRWLTVPAAALRAGLVMGLAASTLGACRDNDPPPNVPPVARNVALETVEDTPLEVSLPASGNGALAFTIVDAPDHGTLSEISANGSVTYTPGADYNGEDALIFRATNRQGQSAEATVTITITPVNDTPTLSPVADQRITAGSSTGDLGFTVGDVETAADNLTVIATSSNTDLVPNEPSNLVLGGSGSSRTLSVVPVASASGSTTITLSVSDGSDTTSTTFTVDVTGLASLYWVTAAGSLWRVDVNGTNAIELETGISGASSIATDPVTRTLFYTRDSAIVRADSDGANPVDIVANGGLPSGLAVDSTNRKLYWSDFNGGRVMRAELDGNNPTQIAGGIDSPSAIEVDVPNGKVYVITYNNTKLIRFNLDGTNLETLASGLGGLGVGLAVDSSGGKVYYSTRGNSIYVANLDGTDVTPLVTNQTTAHGIAIDVTAGRLYWADWLGGVIRSADLADGSDIQDLNSGSVRNLGLAWMPAP
ncbi:Ig-like domain-containing protein [Myxococcus virescens]|uniref:SMP-30/Gluconolaconase/LRE-like region-containing protein n=2 Tax=Myxococcus virescens TaxID=83456 RepID=A0ABY0N7W7_9BACT|nr:Ig-like domain-containing protein [Myxococcus virescens]SDF07358.1 SMP-30/Gluconolaconase/LRE-like region-containing protein [Myxococcus virescens]